MIRQFELVERVKAYDQNADEDALNRAYVFAMKAHGSQKRASGDPYFSHPLEVAGILTGYKLDADSIITALLHDTIEDTEASQEEIVDHFGESIGRLVDGVTKLTRIELPQGTDQANTQAENFRKLVLAMSDDIRVLLVKLADRLHNMRTLGYVKKPEKRRRIALETMEIYAPLAERLGMQELKNELEDLSFAELNPEARESILARLQFLREHDEDLVPRILAELEKVCADDGLKVTVSGREKSPYSIWRKMQRKSVGFEQLSDIMAFRVLVDDMGECYQALGTIHSKYPVVPGRFKDYISTPKANGYKSLHTAVIGPLKHRIEVQIRTRDMHDVAENGVAAHWNYKQETGNTEGRRYRWLRELLDILEHAAGPEEFLEHTKLEMFDDQVFCFTPKGDIINLPHGGTPVDFAYAVHSEVGDTCVGAKVNGRMVPLRTELHNGDQVEIVTSRAQTPSPEWERFVVSGKARARIRRLTRVQQRDQYASLGHSMLKKAFREESYDLSEKGLEQVLKKFKVQSVEDLAAEVGAGNIVARDVVHAVYPGTREDFKRRLKMALPLARVRQRLTRGDKEKTAGVPINGLIPGMAVHYAGCCHPLPGDRIVGIITTGKGVTIHTIDCENLASYSEEPERWLDVSWDQEGATVDHVGRIQVTLSNEVGSLGNMTTLIAKNQGNISNLKITKRSMDFFDMLVDIEVHDVKHLTNIIAALRAAPSINSVDRARG
ncbi:bifunctional (p)ppGpp synthetase/guanosine-3',5'-bis(diphosphate) 3'-pyrophosphohydrolase [Magnetospira sp. QH-2]|uniref:RelA/SpoT family protein n=1 Tax=Magnetospira sp. (strain QH-2) TaxID=1288970 RepID=UPI0003E815AE|nr:bifunctional (p)ppGpp synthetase/guanosine-3',5'-bis(diphosphate) 3'-pyrophosphohydrolase [Magnetospira sp. QH-2]CCQ73571.1 GTP pyrophosphokinase [Magnetospira sp. QH-2]